jgi:hypothetical protein
LLPLLALLRHAGRLTLVRKADVDQSRLPISIYEYTP